jgi:pteridine reductase
VNLRGAKALVTGGAHRLGREVALRLAEAGADVAISFFRSTETAKVTLEELRRHGGDVVGVRADAAEPAQAKHLVEAVLGRFSRLDVLVANSGAFRRTPLDAVGTADWDEMMRHNFETLLLPVREAAGAMQRQRSGCIVAMADVGALRPWGDYIPYCVAKSAVVSLTRTLAIELAPHVRVNAIAPGPILFPPAFPGAARRREIERTVLRRQGEPRDIASAVLFLADNDYVTGSVLPIDGGRLLG